MLHSEGVERCQVCATPEIIIFPTIFEHTILATTLQDDGAHLAHFKTQAEFNAVRRIAGDGEYWVGLFNPQGHNCGSRQACSGKLKWTDLTNFVNENW